MYFLWDNFFDYEETPAATFCQVQMKTHQNPVSSALECKVVKAGFARFPAVHKIFGKGENNSARSVIAWGGLLPRAALHAIIAIGCAKVTGRQAIEIV